MKMKYVWNKQKYKIACKKYLDFLDDNRKGRSADRISLMHDIIDKIKDETSETVVSIAEVDEKIKEIQVLVNTYYPIYKDPVGVSYTIPDVCITAFVEVVEAMENPPQPQGPNPPSDPVPYMPVIPKWDSLKIGEAITHYTEGYGKIIKKIDNGIIRMITVEFGVEIEKKTRSFYTDAFKKGFIIQTEELKKMGVRKCLQRVPSWDELMIGNTIFHSTKGEGVILEKNDNGDQKWIVLRFEREIDNENNAFIYPFAFNISLLKMII